MSATRLILRTTIGCLAALGTFAAPLRAETVQEKFYRAYYLEQTEQDWSAAAKLYEEVARSNNADDALQAKAAFRLAACKEELVSTDFARLMPPDAWAVVELKRPGNQIGKLLNKLGLVKQAGKILEEGKKRIAVSPVLIKEALGIGGAALAITGFDPAKHEPTGVLVLHPGDVEIIRGLIETALPAGGTGAPPIGGFPTYDVEGEVLVTLTSRLVIASTQRSQIEGVISRLTGREKSSLATNAGLAEIAKDRGDSLLRFFVNAKPMMPMIKGLLAQAVADDPDVAIAQVLFNPESLHSLSGRLGVDDDGISLEIDLRLDDSHQNRVFNLLRTPPVDSSIFDSIPKGAAAFIVGALNEAQSRYTSASTKRGDARPVITALDFGREIFANITSFAVFALPPSDAGEKKNRGMPDLAVVIAVNDPSKSQALWSQILGIAGLVNGAAAIEGNKVDIEGITARSYKFPDGITIYFATMDSRIIVGSNEYAVAGAIRAKRSGQSVLSDKAFGPCLLEVSSDTTKAVFVYAGRCARIAKGFMSKRERAETDTVFAVLSDTVGSLVVDHSDSRLRISMKVSGIPDVGDLVAELVTNEARVDEARLAENR